MPVTVTFDLPPEIEERVRASGSDMGDLNKKVKEAYALELYRQGGVEFHELSQMLGLDHIDTSELLQQHRIYRGSITMEELEADRRTLEQIAKKDR